MKIREGWLLRALSEFPVGETLRSEISNMAEIFLSCERLCRASRNHFDNKTKSVRAQMAELCEEMWFFRDFVSHFWFSNRSGSTWSLSPEQSRYVRCGWIFFMFWENRSNFLQKRKIFGKRKTSMLSDIYSWFRLRLN